MSENCKFDLGIIGAGPAGYTAAFQARAKGLSVVLFLQKQFCTQLNYMKK